MGEREIKFVQVCITLIVFVDANIWNCAGFLGINKGAGTNLTVCDFLPEFQGIG
jgi:hypothetical protein